MSTFLKLLLNFFRPKSALKPTTAPISTADTYANNSPINMITKAEILMGRIAEKDLPADLASNLDKLHTAVNKLRAAYGKPLIVSSGYRTPAVNAAAGGAKASNHMKCLAVDFHDADGVFDAWCMANLDVLEDCGLWLEHPDYTSTWTHVQAIAPKSGNRVFKP